MANGDGSIVKVMKDGRQVRDAKGRLVWEVRISTGWDARRGRYGVVTRRVHGTKADARRKRDELNAQIAQGVDPNAGRVTFGEFAARWLEVRIRSEDWAESTKSEYRTRVRQASEFLGAKPVKDVTPLDIEAMYCELRERGLSGSTLRKLHVFLKRVFKYAVDNDLMMRNPCDRVKPPKPNDVDRRSLSAQEAARLLREIGEAESAAYSEFGAKEARRDERGDDRRGSVMGLTELACLTGARLGLATGARRGEVLALAWGSVDLEAGTIGIEASLTPEMEPRKPKTKAGRRTVALDAATVRALAWWRGVQAGALGTLGIEPGDDTPVVSDAKGGHVNPDNFSRWWRGFTAVSGFEGLRFHELRHTQATLLLAQGVDVKTVQNRLGHANASITLDWYAHATPENDRRAAGVLGDLLENPPKARIVPFPKSA